MEVVTFCCRFDCEKLWLNQVPHQPQSRLRPPPPPPLLLSCSLGRRTRWRPSQQQAEGVVSHPSVICPPTSQYNWKLQCSGPYARVQDLHTVTWFAAVVHCCLVTEWPRLHSLSQAQPMGGWKCNTGTSLILLASLHQWVFGGEWDVQLHDQHCSEWTPMSNCCSLYFMLQKKEYKIKTGI